MTRNTIRVAQVPLRPAPAGAHARSALTDALRRGQAVFTRADDDNANAGDKTSSNDEGKPKTPSESTPGLPDPGSVVPENRDEEATDAEELHAEPKEGAGMDWFDALGA